MNGNEDEWEDQEPEEFDSFEEEHGDSYMIDPEEITVGVPMELCMALVVVIGTLISALVWALKNKGGNNDPEQIKQAIREEIGDTVGKITDCHKILNKEHPDHPGAKLVWNSPDKQKAIEGLSSGVETLVTLIERLDN